jgi:hypothetical protein
MALLPVNGRPSESGLLAYSRARWLDRARHTMTLRPTVGRLVANVTTSDPSASP